MILLTSLYSETNSGRRAELFECLRLNVENQYFDEIHLFLEDQSNLQDLASANPILGSAKLRLTPWNDRIKYSDLFTYANRHLSGSRVVISNADIYFDQTLMHLDDHDLSNRLLCLSRWDVQTDGSSVLFEHPASQDAWIFQPPLQEFFCDFPLGVPGCDNRLAWEAEHAGLTVSNPSRSIRAYHLHLTQIRHYTERQRINGPTKPVPAVFMETPYLNREEPVHDVNCAGIAFHETMGYTIARLENGISSHNNESRPFTVIPKSLVGLPFTQVVAYAAAPVEVEFLTSGKLYVLVGNDWDGYNSATTWLRQMGSREALPLVETQCGMGFEVWSLAAETGQRFVIPTQVMLVSDHLVKADPRIYNSDSLSAGRVFLTQEPIFALTSLSPIEKNVLQVKRCIKSWRDAGLQVYAFNHPDEIARLAKIYDVTFVPVTKTAAAVFGRHLIPIKAMFDWATEHDALAFIINSDIQLRMTKWEFKRVRWISDGGLCYFVRYNHNGNLERSYLEPYGMDAFLFHGRQVSQFPDSFLCMGQPFWDYLVPHTFVARGYPIYTVEFPSAFHHIHSFKWSWDNWYRCALEFSRATGGMATDQSFQAYLGLAGHVRQNIGRQSVSIKQSPFPINEWIQKKFNYPGPKIFLELGAYRGDDSGWLAEIPDVNIHAFEPDPRNNQEPRDNVTLHRAAIADYDGWGSLILSEQGWGQVWTHSSSIKKPKNHLLRYPVTFGEEVEVQMITLDSICQQQGLGVIDFIWADIQGAEGEMIRGGKQTLARTRYLYTEYSDDELYENQITLRDILTLLPDFRVLELWEDDVLLENQLLR